MNNELFLLLAVLLCLALSFLMSGMEAGVLALNPLRIRHLKRTGSTNAEILSGFLENPENFLWTILVGNTLANFVVLGHVLVFLGGQFHGHRWLAVLAFTAFVFVFYAVCDLLPKMLFRLYPNRLCLALALPFRAIHLLLKPVVALVAWFSQGLLRWSDGKQFTGRVTGNREELRFAMQEASHTLSNEEKVMVNRVLDLQNLTLRHITVPMNKVITVKNDTLLGEALKLAREHRLLRFPVWQAEAGRHRIAGILSLKPLLYSGTLDPAKPAGDFLKPALFLPEDLPVEEAMRRLRRAGQGPAIVLGRDQREIGIVTLQDILKAIFGEVKL